jgi:hypothetical protein
LFILIISKRKREILNYLQSKFANLRIEVFATEGSLSEQEYEDKIEEALRQSGIELK